VACVMSAALGNYACLKLKKDKLGHRDVHMKCILPCLFLFSGSTVNNGKSHDSTPLTTLLTVIIVYISRGYNHIDT
jgi:hypothetical protein